MPFSALEISWTAVSSRSVGVSRLAAGLPRFNWVTLLTDCLVRVRVEMESCRARHHNARGDTFGSIFPSGRSAPMKAYADSHKTYYGIFVSCNLSRWDCFELYSDAAASTRIPSYAGSTCGGSLARSTS